MLSTTLGHGRQTLTMTCHPDTRIPARECKKRDEHAPAAVSGSRKHRLAATLIAGGMAVVSASASADDFYLRRAF